MSENITETLSPGIEPTVEAPEVEAALPVEAPAGSAEEPAFDLVPPEGVEVDQALFDAYRDVAREAGLSPEQANRLMGWWNERNAGHGSSEEAARTAETELRREWGGQYGARLGEAKRAVLAFGGDQLSQLLERTGLGNDPTIVRTFAAVGKLIAEDGLVGRGSSHFAMAPGQARSEIARLQADRDFLSVYLDARHPAHDESVERMLRLQAIAHP